MLRFRPGPVVQATLGVLGGPSAGERQVSPAVENVFGRPPHSFGDWAGRNVTGGKDSTLVIGPAKEVP